MPTANHYKTAEDALRLSPGDHPERDLLKAQLHAMLAVADELRNVHYELLEIRRLTGAAG